MAAAMQHKDAGEDQQGDGRRSLIVLLTSRTFGGHEKMLLEWLRQAVEGDHLDMEVLCGSNYELLRLCQAANFRVRSIRGLPALLRRVLGEQSVDAIEVWRALGTLSAKGPVLLAPGVVQASPLLLLAALVRRRRVVSYVPMAFDSRAMGFRFAAARDRLIAHLVRKVAVWITITEQQRQLLVDQWRVSAPVHVVPNLLSLPGAPAAVRPGPTSEWEPLRALFLGRFERNQKGLDWLSDQLRKHRPSWTGRMCFTFQGQGEYESQLRLLSSECPPGAVVLAPWGDVAMELNRADVLVLPSRFEGLPLVAIEATHHGVPVVATQQAGLSDVLQPESLFQFGDFDGMRRAMERLRDRQARVAAVTHAQARIRAMLSRERFEQAISAAVRDIVALATTGEPARTGK